MSTTLWIAVAAMSLVAIGFAVWPLYRHTRSFTPLIGVVTLFVAAASAGLYYYQGRPDVQSGGSGELPELEDVVADLAARLDRNPDDVNGWKMLGRSYMTIGDYAGAVEAFERAVQLESAQDAQTLVSLGEALLAHTGAAIDGRIASLFENALAIDPNSPQALFYAGISAFNRNDRELAAQRWERLLALNPPPEIQGILRQRVAEWRGEPPPVAMPAPSGQASAASEPPASATLEREGVVVTASVSLSESAAAALPGDATVFVIARDPAQPVPPIAVTRRRLSELPAVVELGDRESMVPGRSLSGFAEFELVARVSVSGQPGQQSGDWFGAQLVKPAENNRIRLAIDQQVP